MGMEEGEHRRKTGKRGDRGFHIPFVLQSDVPDLSSQERRSSSVYK